MVKIAKEKVSKKRVEKKEKKIVCGLMKKNKKQKPKTAETIDKIDSLAAVIKSPR